MAKPRVLTKCVANQYTGPEERIVEFAHKGKGGLIALREVHGVLHVNVYRTDAGVIVHGDGMRRVAHTYTEEEERELGEGLARMLQLRRTQDRRGWQTLWGWKTGLGLFRMLRNVMTELDAGSVPADLKARGP